MLSDENESTFMRYRSADDTAYLLALSDPYHRWIGRQDLLHRIGTPRLADLTWVCELFNWSVCVHAHRGSKRVYLHPIGGRDDCLEGVWGESDSPIQVPEHALLLLMSELHYKD